MDRLALLDASRSRVGRQRHQSAKTRKRAQPHRPSGANAARTRRRGHRARYAVNKRIPPHSGCLCAETHRAQTRFGLHRRRMGQRAPCPAHRARVRAKSRVCAAKRRRKTAPRAPIHARERRGLALYLRAGRHRMAHQPARQRHRLQPRIPVALAHRRKRHGNAVCCARQNPARNSGCPQRRHHPNPTV